MAVFGRWGHRGPYRKGEVKIRYTKLLARLEIVGLILLAAIFIYTAFRYPMLPDEVPTHYGVTGEADAWGGKGHLWFVPFVAAIVYGLVTLAAFFPNAWNYPAKIDEDKLEIAENNVRQLLMYMKILITCMFGYMQLKMLSLSGSVSMTVTFVFMILLLILIVYYIGKLKRLSSDRGSILKKMKKD